MCAPTSFLPLLTSPRSPSAAWAIKIKARRRKRRGTESESADSLWPRCLLPQVRGRVGCQVEMRSHTVCSPATGLWLCTRPLAEIVAHTHMHMQARAGTGSRQGCSHSAQEKRKPDRMKLRYRAVRRFANRRTSWRQAGRPAFQTHVASTLIKEKNNNGDAIQTVSAAATND